MIKLPKLPKLPRMPRFTKSSLKEQEVEEYWNQVDKYFEQVDKFFDDCSDAMDKQLQKLEELEKYGKSKTTSK